MQMTLLAKYACKPANFKMVVGKVQIAMLSIKRRRGLHRLFGKRLADLWVLDTSDPAFLGTG